MIHHDDGLPQRFFQFTGAHPRYLIGRTARAPGTAAKQNQCVGRQFRSRQLAGRERPVVLEPDAPPLEMILDKPEVFAGRVLDHGHDVHRVGFIRGQHECIIGVLALSH